MGLYEDRIPFSECKILGKLTAVQLISTSVYMCVYIYMSHIHKFSNSDGGGNGKKQDGDNSWSQKPCMRKKRTDSNTKVHIGIDDQKTS